MICIHLALVETFMSMFYQTVVIFSTGADIFQLNIEYPIMQIISFGMIFVDEENKAKY